jgi:hypothetical protein
MSSRRMRPSGWSSADPNLACIGRFMLAVAIAAAVATMAKLPVFLHAFAVLLLLGGVARGASAALAEEPLLHRHLTRWDEAAALFALGFFIDMVASLATR